MMTNIELKAKGVDDVYIEYYNTGKHELAQVYLKSEVDKVIADIVKGATSMFREFSCCRGLDTKSPLGRIADVAFRHWISVESIQNKNQQLQEDKERLLQNNRRLLDEVERLKEAVADARQKACGYQEIINKMERQERHHKYKRCLKMAELCRAKRDEIIARTPTLILNHPTEYLTRWENRWLELAEKFKEAK